MSLPGPIGFGPGAGTSGLASGSGRPRSALAVRQGRPQHFEAHLNRLRNGAAALRAAVPWLPGAASDLLAWLAPLPGEAALRLALDPDLQVLEASLEPLPPAPNPCRLTSMPHPGGDLRGHPLATHKGLSGPWRAEALTEARLRGAEDALLLWPDGSIAESPIATVALERNGVLTLPPRAGRVAGVTEQQDLPGWAEARGWALRWTDIFPEEAHQGRFWCMNALRGLWPATLLQTPPGGDLSHAGR